MKMSVLSIYLFFFHINNLSLPHTKKENNNKAEVKN